MHPLVATVLRAGLFMYLAIGIWAALTADLFGVALSGAFAYLAADTLDRT